MKTFKVPLHRTFIVTIRAENVKEARSLCEYFIGTCRDESTSAHRAEYNFEIEDIEMIWNDAFNPFDEIEEINDEVG